MARFIGYCRVSTEDQAREGISLEAQRARLEAWAEFEGAELVAIECDAGLSAKSLDRPGLQRALAAIASGDADGLVVVKLDRLTRSVADLGRLIEGPFKRAELVSLGEKIDTASASGRMIVNLLATVSQWERETAAERTSAAMQHMKRQGLVVGSVPYGWRAEPGPDGRKRLVEIPGEQAVLVVAKQLRAAGLSLRAIAAELERMGHLSRCGRRFDSRQILTMVTNNAA